MMPFLLPTKMRLPTTVTCEPEDDTPGRPNAHFTRSFGTSLPESPAPALDCCRVFRTSAPHPFQAAPASGFGCEIVAALQYAVFAIWSSGARYEPGGLPARNSATARRSADVSVAPCRRMANELRALSMCSGVNLASAARLGMRGMAPSWHAAQCCL